MIEKRASERFTKEVSVTFYSGKDHYSGISSNFSVSGLFIKTAEPLKPGTPLKITLEISKKEKIYLEGIVIRSIKTGESNINDGMGIKLKETPFIYDKFINKLTFL